MPREPEKLATFEAAHRLVVDVYKLSGRLPVSERFGLASQLRRAAVSIPTNIVEGCSRRSPREYERFLEIAIGSAVEVRYLLRLVADLGLLPQKEVQLCKDCSDRVARTLQNVRRTVAEWD